MTTAHVRDKIDRLTAFWSRENYDRPLLAFTGSYYPKATLQSLGVAEGLLRPEDIDIDAFVEHCDVEYQQWAEHMGDGFWAATPVWGVPWGQAILGRNVMVGDGSIWNDHAKVPWDEIDRLCRLENNAWLELLLEMTDRLSIRSNGRYPMSTLITPGILVILSELRGMSELVFDVVDEPNRVQWAIKRITEAFLLVLDAYCHLHSTQLHTLDTLLADDAIRFYELCPDEGYDIQEIISILRKILRQERCVITHAFFSTDEVDQMVAALPPEGLYIGVRAESVEQAAELKEQIMVKRGWC